MSPRRARRNERSGHQQPVGVELADKGRRDLCAVGGSRAAQRGDVDRLGAFQQLRRAGHKSHAGEVGPAVFKPVRTEHEVPHAALDVCGWWLARTPFGHGSESPGIAERCPHVGHGKLLAVGVVGQRASGRQQLLMATERIGQFGGAAGVFPEFGLRAVGVVWCGGAACL